MGELVFIDTIVRKAATNAVKTLFGAELAPDAIQLQETRKEFDADITLVVFPLTKLSKKGPEETGKLLGDYLTANEPGIASYSVVKGFLNMVMSDAFWTGFMQQVAQEAHYGFSATASRSRVLVEYASPNTNKPLHLGHLRNIFLGHSVANVLAANGHIATRVQIINDRGIHICKSMVAWKHFANGATPESSGMKGDKFVGHYYVLFDKSLKEQVKAGVANGLSEEDATQSAPIMQEAQEMLRQWEARDVEVIDLWKRMNGWVYEGFNATYAAMGVTFDKLYYESDTYLLGKKEVEEGLARGIFFRKEDGSIWVDLTEDGLDQKALLRKDGTAMYITQDIGTAILRFSEFPDAEYQIYTVGNEQEYHFKVLFRILNKLGFAQAGKCYHLSYGMVELPEGKMKSREGTVVDADDIMDEMAREAAAVSAEQGKLDGLTDDEKSALHRMIGMAALKFFLLRVDPRKNMLFNPRESIDFNGDTGPFVQYTYVRTGAVLRKAAETSIELPAAVPSVALQTPEKRVLRKLHAWPQVVQQASREYNPALIAHYCIELARDFNGFYQDNPIVRESDVALRGFRLHLVKSTGRVIKDALGLLGIEVPERM
ncbi:MAG: arginine--tRNA ligase [Flavobacteriales bacterium]|nr:arginine--tRNA ligase [Flavobacteriales bacterium]